MISRTQTLNSEQAQIRGQFIDFLENQSYERKYSERVNAMMHEGKSRLILDMGDLLSYNVPIIDSASTSGFGADATTNGSQMMSLGIGVIHHPTEYIPLCEIALYELVMRKQADYLKVNYRSLHINAGFEGPVGNILGPRDLYARHLNTLVAIEGIVTKQSALRPRLVETVHYCPTTNKFSRKQYRDQLTPVLDASALPTINIMPKVDQNGNLLRLELGLSSFTDAQCAILQEAPEASPTGQLPRSVELRFDDDLVDSVKAGDRVIVVGTYIPYSTDNKSFQSIVLVNNVVHNNPAEKDSAFAPIEKEEMRCMCQQWLKERGPAGVLKYLSQSIAPSIYGLTNEKQAILLQLVGGVERKAHDTHVRGNINILIVGEPSTAKSQLLRFVLGVAPLALSTTGKGSSGVGLTAAVTVDQYSGERSLSAGAMVLADRGILCIDELDKMSPNDRVAMHEAMEQQTVTITKACIHTTLNSRCSVLAAANPVYGFYSVNHKLAFNVGLPESLLSRFDLIFITLDHHNAEHNRKIGGHILHNHMSASPAAFDTKVIKTVVEAIEIKPLGKDKRFATLGAGKEQIVSTEFLRRYIIMAKAYKPIMSEAAAEMVSQVYVELRQEQNNGGADGFFVTARTLESIIRLASANAKLCLREVVNEDDVAIAMSLIRASVHAASEANAQRAQESRGDGEGLRSTNLSDNEKNININELSCKQTCTVNGPGLEELSGRNVNIRNGAGVPLSEQVVLDALMELRLQSVATGEGVSISVLREQLTKRLGASVEVEEVHRIVSHIERPFFTFEEGGALDSSAVYFQ